MSAEKYGSGTYLEPAARERLLVEFHERWARAGYPSLVHHILGNMSQTHGIPLGVLKELTRAVRAERQHPRGEGRPSRTAGDVLGLAVVDGSNLAWARTDDSGRPRLDNLTAARRALAERGYEALVVVDAALRHQVSQRDAAELDRLVLAQTVVQAPAATDGDRWILQIADHHAAAVVSNDRFEEYRADFGWIDERRVAIVFVEHAAILQGEGLNGAGRSPTSAAALRAEIEQLREAAGTDRARAEDAAAVRARLARIEGRLAREQGRSAELQAEVSRLVHVVAEERRTSDAARQEIRQHPEQIGRLGRGLAEAQEEAATARGQRDALQARAADLERQVEQLRARRPEERTSAATRNDLEAVRGELRGEIRDLSRSVKDSSSRLPRVLAMTREVREAVSDVQQSQQLVVATLERLADMCDSLRETTNYLTLLAEADHLDVDDDLSADDDENEEVAGEAVEETATVAFHASPDAADAIDEDAIPDEEDDWQAEFERVEHAWLVGWRVGDRHEALNFLHLVEDLNMDEWQPAKITDALDRFNARAGADRLSYCSLHGAVHLVRRKPSLDNPLVLVRYRELVKQPPCTDFTMCPSLAETLAAVERSLRRR
jgi:uncharacterized coiled-coil DUF342 family protein